MPSWSSPRPSSLGRAAACRRDTSPRILRRSSVKPPGSVAPDRRVRHDHARDRCSARRTPRAVWPSPKSTSASGSLSASGCGTTSRIRATTTPVISAPGLARRPRPRGRAGSSAAAMSATGASTGVNSRIQESGARDRVPQYCARKRTSPSKKFLIVVDAVAEHRDPLDAEAEREPGVLLGVDADRRGTRWGRPCPQPPSSIQPVLRAHAAARAVAEHAAHRELGRRLGVTGRSRGGSACGSLVAEERAHERLDGAEQVGRA